MAEIPVEGNLEALETTVESLRLSPSASAIVNSCRAMAEAIDLRLLDADPDDLAKLYNTYLRYLRALHEQEVPEEPEVVEEPEEPESEFEVLMSQLVKPKKGRR